jgi:hypothetical protein
MEELRNFSTALTVEEVRMVFVRSALVIKA